MGRSLGAAAFLLTFVWARNEYRLFSKQLIRDEGREAVAAIFPSDTPTHEEVVMVDLRQKGRGGKLSCFLRLRAREMDENE